MKYLSTLFFYSLLSVLFVQCQKDEITETPMIPVPSGNDTIMVTSDISSNTSWTSGNTYILNSMIAVTNNATLTIESCVVVKAANGATGLVITQGAKIDAQGTATCPIIFTSTRDQLKAGDIVSPNLTGADKGLWSGLFILGDAPVSSSNGTNMLPFGAPLPIYVYGGNDANDNSGTLRYVSIRHTGFQTAQDETPCGLYLAGVGRGTTIDKVELFANTDDGFLVHGGTVDVDNVVTSHFGDDGFDCDKGFAGTMDNLIGIMGSENNSALELDGGEGADNPSYTIRNASFKGSQNGEMYIDFQQNVHCRLEEAYFFNFDADAIVKLDRDRDADNWLAELIDVSNLQFKTSHLSMGNKTIESIFVDAGANGNDAFTIRMPDANIVTTPATGADKSVFTGWTVASATGALNDF